MSLEWYLYLAEKSGLMQVVFIIFAILCLVGVVLCISCGYDGDTTIDVQKCFHRIICKILLPLFIVSSFFGIGLPSTDTSYKMLAVKYGKEIIHDPLMQKIFKTIENKIDEINEEEK